MNPLRTLFLGSALLALPHAALAEPSVVVSIKPIHSLVAGVMQGVGEPELIVDGAASPHTHSLRPSQAGHLENADVVFWVGPQLEAFLESPLETLSRDSTVVNLSTAHGLKLLEIREGGTFEDHEHDDHGDHSGHDAHDDHDDHATHQGDDDHEKHAEHDDHEGHADHDDHATHQGDDDHEKHAEHDDHEGHADHADHDGAYNLHVWLDPANAKTLVHEIEETLAAVDPQNAARYAENAGDLAKRLDALTTEVAATLEPVQGKSFIVFHDAYPYFENRFGVSAAGSVTVSPEVSPGAARVSEIKDKVKELGVACVFSEPQFEPKLIQVITEGTAANAGVLDPLGAEIDNGPELYFDLIRSMANDMRACLAGNS